MKTTFRVRALRAINDVNPLRSTDAAEPARLQGSPGVHGRSDGRDVRACGQQSVAQVHERSGASPNEPADALFGRSAAQPNRDSGGSVRLVPGSRSYGRLIALGQDGVTKQDEFNVLENLGPSRWYSFPDRRDSHAVGCPASPRQRMVVCRCNSSVGRQRVRLVAETAMKVALRVRVAICIGVAACLLPACGGGGGGADSQPVSAPVALKAVSIDAEGDSTMYGSEYPNGILTRASQPAPAVAQADLQVKLGTGVTIENNGVPGGTVSANLAGSTLAPLATRLASDPSQIVLENFGINPAFTDTADKFHADLTTWVNTVKGMGKTPVLEEPNPVTRDGYAALPAFAAIINQVGKEQGVLVIQQYAYIQTLPNWQAMLTDGVHPNDALYAIKGQREATQLQALVQSLR